MHFTCQKMHLTARVSLAGILLTGTQSLLANARGCVEFYTTDLSSRTPKAVRIGFNLISFDKLTNFPVRYPTGSDNVT